MPLDDTQKAEARKFLGFPDATREPAYILEGALSEISEPAVAQVAVILTDLATIETGLRASWTRQMVEKAEEVTLTGEKEIFALRREGGRLVNALSVVLGVAPLQSYFSSGASLTAPFYLG